MMTFLFEQVAHMGASIRTFHVNLALDNVVITTTDGQEWLLRECVTQDEVDEHGPFRFEALQEPPYGWND